MQQQQIVRQGKQARDDALQAVKNSVITQTQEEPSPGWFDDYAIDTIQFAGNDLLSYRLKQFIEQTDGIRITDSFFAGAQALYDWSTMIKNGMDADEAQDRLILHELASLLTVTTLAAIDATLIVNPLGAILGTITLSTGAQLALGIFLNQFYTHLIDTVYDHYHKAQ